MSPKKITTTYSMQMERMRAPWRSSRNREFNNFVRWQGVDAARRKQLLSRAGSTLNLQEDINIRGAESSTIDGESGARRAEGDSEINRDISRSRASRSARVLERMKIGFQKSVGRGCLSGCWVLVQGSSNITKNCRVETTREALGTKIGVGADPIVPDWLVCIQDERVTLSGKYLNRIDCQRLHIDPINFDNRLDDDQLKSSLIRSKPTMV
jgi:hypothetical protein